MGRGFLFALCLLIAAAPDCFALTIPANIVGIEEGAFQGDSAIESVELPKTVASVGKNAFADCSSLERITVLGENTVLLENALGRPGETRTIIGYANSTAQKYCQAYGFTFQVIPTKAVKLLAYADKLIDTEYKTLDCVTFVRHCYRNALGITTYATCPDVANKTAGTKITKLADLQPGDIICWTNDDYTAELKAGNFDKVVCTHVGIYVGPGTVGGKTYTSGVYIESSRGAGKVRYNYIPYTTTSNYYVRNFMFAWRIIDE